MTEPIVAFEDAYRRTSASADAKLKPLLLELHDAYTASPADPVRAQKALICLFEALTTSEMRTDGNCRAVDRFLMENASLSKSTALPLPYVEFLINADALHDSITDPEVAENFESTPEQLLLKARSL